MHLRRLLDRPERRPSHHGRADRVRAELKRGHDAEVAAAASQRPEQLRVLVGARVHERAVGEHDLGADQAVDRQAVAARQMAQATAEREPADAGRRDDPRRRRTAVLGGRPIDLRPRCSPRRRVPCWPVRSTVTSLMPARSITSPSSTTPRPPPLCPPPRTATGASVGTRERDAAGDVVGARAADDQRRVPVDHPVVDGSRFVVARVSRSEHAVIEVGELAVARSRPAVRWRSSMSPV